MPISQKIIDHLNNALISREKKDLMMEMLKIEDNGSIRFRNDYEKAINEFIEKNDKGENEQ